MKRIFCFLLFLAFLQTGWAQTNVVTAADFHKLKWLEGAWNRTNLKPGSSAHESWTRISDKELKGQGVTLKGKDTAFVEKISIIVKDNALYYVADVPHNKQPVYFKFTAITADGFVCENPEHDFPKKIEYRQEGSILKATISGNGKAIPFVFERK